MLVHASHETVRPEWSSAVVCVGTFDGVHLGHREVIGHCVRLAREREVPAIVATFDRHPAATLAPERAPVALATLGDNLERFAEIGVDLALVEPFTSEFSQTSAPAFLDTLRDRLKASAIVIGHDFAFGRGREGTTDWLAERIETHVVPPFELNGVRVSSSAIRRAIAAGDVATATHLLGRPYRLTGMVIGGQRLGRTLGYPTANLATSESLAVPQDGVYSGIAQTPFGEYRAAIGIGMRPTVEGTHRTIEAFLIDYKGESLYGRPVSLGFERRLRDEVRFATLEELQAQMALDVKAARG